jgi:hypothetical protein
MTCRAVLWRAGASRLQGVCGCLLCAAVLNVILVNICAADRRDSSYSEAVGVTTGYCACNKCPSTQEAASCHTHKTSKYVKYFVGVPLLRS